MLDISIIIVSYNTKDFTKQCIQSIYDNVSGVSFEIICVDNNSMDGSVSMIENSFPNVTLIKNERNLGYAKANNIGIDNSSGTYLVLLNSDTVIMRYSLESIIEFMDNHPDAGAASPKLLNPNGTIQYCVRSLPDIKTAILQSLGWHKLFPSNKTTDKYYRNSLDYDKVLSVDSIGTTCYVIRREVLKNVGLLDEDFFMYNVDLDYNKRIKNAGYNIYYVPEAKVIHYGGVSVNQKSYRGLIEQHQGMWLMYKKHYAAKRNMFVNVFVFIGIYLRLLIKIILAFFAKDKRVIKGPGAPEKIELTCPDL
ncbi:MAG: glycosyltransferase family 2 protein [Sedimentisphaerales bacterium]|nr:glycosyltransferase family 2 protein [Sedimentisphaerales bacterium]